MNDFLKQLKQKPKGVFVFIDDDKDEFFLLKRAMKELGLDNQVVCCNDGLEAFNYLRETNDDIFIILSDVNMPKMDGLQLKRLIDVTPETKIKAIPFIFHSNSGSHAEIRAAYESNIQAFLRKGESLEETIEHLKIIIAMWTNCVHPKELSAKI